MRSMGNLGRLLKVAVLIGMAAVLVGVPLAASANPDISGFELDGNAAGSSGADWDALGSPLRFTGFRDDPVDDSDTGYGSGLTKDTKDVSLWTWEKADVTPAKSDIVNDYAAVYSEAGNLILYFGQNRQLDREGDANVGFWFLQGGIALPAGKDPDKGTFDGSHVDGDLLVQSEFTNGGDISDIRVFKWQSGGIVEVTTNVGECADGKLGTLDACAIVNSGTISTSWAGSITSPYFFEGGVNLSALYQQSIPCFSTFLTNTRTSQAEDADLKDFSLGSIDTCASIKITKQATPSDGTQFGYSTTGGLDPSTFSLTDGGSKEYKQLQPGSFSVTEDALSGGWAFDSLSCPTATGPGTSAQVDGMTANITLGFIGRVECTYVNKRKPQVKVVKATVPTTDSGKFDLQINGTTHADDVGNGGDTGFQELSPGPVTVGELAGTGTDLAGYDSNVSCDSGKGSAGGTTHSFSVDFGDKVTCTITNSRKPEVKVVKVTDPTTDTGKFNLLINGTVERANAMNGQDTGFKQVAAGAVTVSETAGTSTSLSSYNSKVECDSSKGSTNPGTSHGFTANYGDRVTCTITNTRKATLTVIKHVINDNGGSKSASDFPIQVSGSNPSLASFPGAEAPGTSVSIDPGSYNVTETEDPAYAASYSAGCSGTVPAGGTATCTITNNDLPPKLTLVKVVVNDNGGTEQASAWTLTASGPSGFSGAGPSVSSGASFDQGSYNLSESGPSGYDASDWVCSKGQADGDTVSVGLGDDVTCTITNDDRPAELIVIKTVVNDDGGAAVSSAWTMNVAGPTPLSFPGAASPGTSNQVDAGAYKVTESGGPAGYTLSYSGDCDADGDVSLALGQTKTCVLTNNDQPATLTVIKNVVNDNGGTASASAFTMTINGVTADGGNSFPGAGAPGVQKTITSFGAYDVTESTVSGYTQTSASADCSGTIALGQHKTCTITNDDDAPKLTLVKEVVNDNGGTAQASAWTLTASGPSGFSGAGPSVSSGASFDQGSYNLSESGPSGYDASDWVCSEGQVDGDTVSVGLGDDVTCTITNDDKAPKLTLVKVVVNDNGGTEQASAWTLTASGPSGFSGAGPSVSSGASFDAGSYDLSESGPAGYDASSWVCSKGQADGDTVSVGLGDDVTCTITNNDQAPKLTLVKVVVNDDGGTAVPGSWTLDADGPTGFSGAGPSVSSGASFDAGSYDLSESDGPAGYEASDWSCNSESQVDGDTVSVGLGDDVTCTITNDDKPATLVVKKVVVNDNGGANVASDFSFQVNSGAAQPFEADGQNDLTVAAGTYTVTEPAVAGYTTSYSNCSNLVIPLGGSATCTVTNNDVPRGQGSITVSKSANPVTLKEPGGPVTFSVTITNTSADVDVTISNVVDNVFGDLDDDGGNGCFDVPINMAPGDKANCTFQRQVTGQGGTSHVNVVTASGNDENGNPLSASDDARVDITPRLIDLVIVKDATSPTPLNGIVNYTMTVTNKGPDDATNVQVADPAPAGILYLSADPTQGTCTVTQSLITCGLGTLEAGETVTIRVTARATTVGTHTNTATVTGGGGRETNPADNVDSAITVVPAPARPPVAKPTPEPEVCLTLTVSPKMITADGRPDKVTVKVTAGKKRVKGAKVSIAGAGVKKTGRSNGKGVAVLKVNPRKPGLITITAVETNQRVCGPKRIGVVGVFLPPLTG